MKRRWPVLTLQIVVGVLLMFWSLAPIYWGFIVSLTTSAGIESVPPPIFPHPFTFGYYHALLNGQSAASQDFLRSFWNSIVESVFTTLLTVAIATMAGYAFVRFTFRGSFFLFIIIIGTMSLPVYAVLIPLFKLITNVNLMNTYFAIIIINCSSSLPLAVWLIRSHVASLPIDIEEAARIDGASRRTLITRIVMPMIAPGVGSTSVIVFLSAWSSFLVPLIFASTIKATPATVVITQFASKFASNYGLQAAAGVVSLLPPVLVVAWFNRHLIRGLLGGAMTS